MGDQEAISLTPGVRRALPQDSSMFMGQPPSIIYTSGKNATDGKNIRDNPPKQHNTELKINTSVNIIQTHHKYADLTFNDQPMWLEFNRIKERITTLLDVKKHLIKFHIYSHKKKNS